MSYTFIIPDLHAPYQDPTSWGVTLKAVKKLKPERVIIIGDFADCYSVSSFSKHPLRRSDLRSEIDSAREELYKLIRAADCEIDYLEGNHEFRLERYLCEKAPELYGLVSIKELMLAGTRGVNWVPYRDYLQIGKVLYTHDVGHAGVYAGKHTLTACAHNVVFGHTHRGGIVTDGTHTGERRFSLNVGWLGDPSEINYVHRVKMKDWIHGFGLIDTDPLTGLVWPSFVPILEGKARVGGIEISL